MRGGGLIVCISYHAPSRGRTKRSRGVTLWRLGWPSVIDKVVFDIGWQLFPVLKPLQQLRMGDIARNHQRARETQASRDGKRGEFSTDICHWSKAQLQHSSQWLHCIELN
jgi:hypothetical protein